MHKKIFGGEKENFESVTEAALSEGLKELKADERKSMLSLPMPAISSRDSIVEQLLKDSSNGLTLQASDLFTLLKKFLQSTESKTLLDSQRLQADSVLQKFSFNTDFKENYREALLSLGVRQAKDIPELLSKAGIKSEHFKYGEMQSLLKNILSEEDNLSDWLSAQNVFILLTILLHNNNKYNLPFDLMKRKSSYAFYLASITQDELLKIFTNLAEVSLETIKNGFNKQTAVFKITIQAKTLQPYEKLLTLLMILGKIDLPWETMHIYCQDGNRDTFLDGMNFYAAFTGTRQTTSIANAVRRIDELRALSQNAKKENKDLELKTISPYLTKSMMHLDSALTTGYYPATGFFMRLAGQETIIPFVIGDERIMFGQRGEYLHGQENAKVRHGYETAFAKENEKISDLDISHDFYRLSPKIQEYFQKISAASEMELNYLPIEGHAIHLIDRINNPITKGGFIEKIIELLYRNYDSLSFEEKNRFAEALILAIHKVSSATDSVKIACRRILHLLIENKKISPHNYEFLLDQHLSYRSLESYTNELLKEITDFQKGRQDFSNLKENLITILQNYLPLLWKQQNNGFPPRLVRKIENLKDRFSRTEYLIEPWLTDLIKYMDNARIWFHSKVAESEEFTYRNKAPSENPLAIKMRPLILNLRNVLANAANQVKDRKIFNPVRQSLDAIRNGQTTANIISAQYMFEKLLGTTDLNILRSFIQEEMSAEAQKLIRPQHSFEQDWNFRGNGSVSAYVISSILAYARNLGITSSMLAEKLYKIISAKSGSIPGLSKDYIETKLESCKAPTSEFFVNASIEKLLISVLVLETGDISCAFKIGQTCNQPKIIGKPIYKTIENFDAETAMALVEGPAANIHDIKTVYSEVVGASFLKPGEMIAVTWLEFNEKAKNYGLFSTINILLWTLGAMSCIPQIADNTSSADIESFMFVEQGQIYEELKKAYTKLHAVLKNPDSASEEFLEAAQNLQKQLVSLHLVHTFPKGRGGGFLHKLLRGGADKADYSMNRQLLLEDTKALQSELQHYWDSDANIKLPYIQTPAVTALDNEKIKNSAYDFMERVGLFQKRRGRNSDYIILSEYADQTGKTYLVRRLLSDSASSFQIGDLKLKETLRSRNHLKKAREILKME